ncbi:MAG: FG-GAP repeat protein [Anaerolineales bacterium]|nr:FG-GAP repeat protein [Anaerolineales bacterium]
MTDAMTWLWASPEDIGAIANAGAVNVLYGSVARLTAAGNQFWNENTAGIAGISEANDNYGWSLVALDFNANNRDDLAIGIPYEDFGALTNNGAVNVIFGAAGGLNAAGNSVTWQNAAGVLDVAESNDIFGYALTAGDFNGDNRDDLGVGVPYEDVGAIVNAGAVNVLYNLFAGGNQFFTQNTAGVLDVSEANDLFGYSLAVGDFNNNGRDDLVVGVPFENLGASIDAGGVNVLYGSLGAGGQQFWWQDSAGILGVAEPGDAFGLSNQ